ncbi:MAG: chemotaxis protein CheX [Phycisphaerae bacterium]|jgi:CheY-specific phosphatase CheX|nr:chemotaxis protein CheX [Phycisphaerae bacterium]
MKQITYDNELYQVAAGTLESLAMMFLVSEDEAPITDASKSDQIVSVTFDGPFSGRLTISVSESMLGELAANMLGVMGADETTTDQRHDALRELANVVCGNLLPKLAGVDPVFNVHQPALSHQIPETAEATAKLFALEGRMELWLCLDQRASLFAPA